jgi:hypothetical protein
VCCGGNMPCRSFALLVVPLREVCSHLHRLRFIFVAAGVRSN